VVLWLILLDFAMPVAFRKLQCWGLSGVKEC